MSSQQHHSPTCILAEDELLVRIPLKKMLEGQDYQVLEAENGVAAWKLVEQLGDLVELILTDVRMPGGDGLEFAFKAREQFSTLPIIVMSAYPESQLRLSPSSSFVFLPKPFTHDALLNSMRKAKEIMQSRKNRGV